MRKTALIFVLAALVLVAPGLVPRAAADHLSLWIAGGSFSLGGLNVSLVLHSPEVYVRGLAPGYYYRFDRPIAYSGYHCGALCYVDHGVTYHHESCPLARHAFARYGYEPSRFLVRYAPLYRGGYYGHPSYRPDVRYRYDARYDRDRRFDRRVDRRVDRRQDRRYDRREDRRDDRDRDGDGRFDRDRSGRDAWRERHDRRRQHEHGSGHTPH